MTSTENTDSKKESLALTDVSSTVFVSPFTEKMGGGYFVKTNSNDIFEKEFTATDPWEY